MITTKVQYNEYIRTEKDEKDNAACPLCFETWYFNPLTAVLSFNDRVEMRETGWLNVLCEDCVKDPDIQDVESALMDLGLYVIRAQDPLLPHEAAGNKVTYVTLEIFKKLVDDMWEKVICEPDEKTACEIRDREMMRLRTEYEIIDAVEHYKK